MGNPCFCGCSLKKACLIIAITEMILYGFVMLIMLIAFGLVIFEDKSQPIEQTEAIKNILGNGSQGWALVSVIIILIIFTAQFYLSIILKRGSIQEDFEKCQIWLIASTIFLVVGIFMVIQDIVLNENMVDIVVGMILPIFKIFALYVVYEFMKEIKRGRTYQTKFIIPGATTLNV